MMNTPLWRSEIEELHWLCHEAHSPDWLKRHSPAPTPATRSATPRKTKTRKPTSKPKGKTHE